MHISQMLYSLFNNSYRARKWYLRNVYPHVAPVRTTVKMVDGTFLYLQPRHDYVQREIFLYCGNYFYEKHIIEWLSKNLRPGLVTVEVGAHIGYYTGHVCRKISPSGRAFFIEPLPEHIKSLKLSLKKNNYEIGQAVEAAISDKNGELFLYPSTDSGRNSLAKNNTTDANPVVVQTLTLEQFSIENNITKIDLLQIDVEGAESLVVLGGKSLFASHKVEVILCELHPKQLHSDFGVRVVDFIHSLTEHGYKVFRLDPNTNREVPLEENKYEEYQHLVFRLPK